MIQKDVTQKRQMIKTKQVVNNFYVEKQDMKNHYV
jgi:hypothetical protein